jgi:hypothetical protein
MSLASRSIQEVIELHAFFQAWFNGECPKTEESFARVRVAWPEPFTLIDPSHTVRRSHELLRQTYLEYGAYPGLKIQVRNPQALHETSENQVVVAYEEWHVDPKGQEGRMCTAILGFQYGVSSRVPKWLHVHESSIAKDA